MYSLIGGIDKLNINNLDYKLLGIPKFGINSVIDMLLVSFICYNILVWVKETRAWSLVKAVIVVLIVWGISVLLNLYTVTWMIRKSLSISIFSVIVIFQPEIRRALEKLGKSGYLNLFESESTIPGELSEVEIDEILEASAKMAAVNTGALIVIERIANLNHLIATGINVDALISRQLLINIFENKTPLHDGAVIIKKNRIAAASCILPLTLSEVSSELGTRHRAAIGTSENTDAFVIVVSEETGAISVANDGIIYRDLTKEEIKAMIMDISKPSKTIKSFLRRSGDNEKV